MGYISSFNNRWYCQRESSYGQVPGISGANRFSAVSMSVKQQVDAPRRRDKTGSCTFAGGTAGQRKSTDFNLTTYMASWPNPAVAPGYGPLFQAALGATPLFFPGGLSTSASTSLTLRFGSSHGLAPGQAITFNGEMRFVASVIDQTTALLNAPLSSAPVAGSVLGATVTYLPSSELPSVSIFDYWTPAAAVQRILCGCGIDRLSIDVNGDYHQFGFSGKAQDVIDTGSFQTAMGQLSAYPQEPVLDPTPITVIAGNLGQIWLGPIASRFYTLTGAKVTLDNNLAMRTDEFGSVLPRGISPGQREVRADFDLYSQDDNATVGLYQAARQRSPIVVAIQLGQVTGQLFGMYMKSVVPEVPEFNDKESRLQWSFRGAQAQGQGDDELAVAFG